MNAGEMVVVRVVVSRTVLEERTDADGDSDYHVIKRDIVSEREWVEDRKTALGETVDA